MHSPTLKRVILCMTCVFRYLWEFTRVLESICEHSEHDGESLAALPAEEATCLPIQPPQ